MSPEAARRAPRRPLAIAWGVFLCALILARDGAADSLQVPLELQVELLAKVAPYDRNFAERARERVRVLILMNGGDADSRHSAEVLDSVLGGLDRIGGLAHEEMVLPFDGAASLAETCRARRIAIVYLSSGLGSEVERIRAALDGVDVLSASIVPDYVPRGIVLGFEASSGRPKLTVNLTQARKQNVALGAAVLKLMKVYE